MNPITSRPARILISLAAVGALAACAGLGGVNDLQRYQCGNGIEFTARFADDTAVLDGSRGKAILYRDAGGQGEQTVYSNPQLRAEFGLGANGREAKLHYLQPPLQMGCMRG